MSRSPREAFAEIQTLARKSDRNTQVLLELFVHERFLARVATSPYRERFVLKGGMLLATMGVRRPTRDADVLALGLPNDQQAMNRIVAEIAAIDLDDGVVFDGTAISATEIREDAEYRALRLSLPVEIAQAKLKLKLDINFGDPVAPETIRYPTILEDAPFELLGYPIETVLAEKGETMVARGDANTRLRDFGDVMLLGQGHSVEQGRLHRELVAVAEHRQRELRPIGEVLETLPSARQADWTAYADRASLDQLLPPELRGVVDYVIAFLDPAIGGNGAAVWDPATGQWRSR